MANAREAMPPANDARAFAQVLRESRQAVTPAPAPPEPERGPGDAAKADASPATPDGKQADDVGDGEPGPARTETASAAAKSRARAAAAKPGGRAGNAEARTHDASRADSDDAETKTTDTHGANTKGAVHASGDSGATSGLLPVTAGSAPVQATIDAVAARAAAGTANGTGGEAKADATAYPFDPSMPAHGNAVDRAGKAASRIDVDAGEPAFAAAAATRADADASKMSPGFGPLLERSLDAAGSAPAASSAAAFGSAPAPVDANAVPMVSVPVPVDSPDFAPAFALQVSILAQGGTQHAELHLNPVEMGPVSIQINLDGTQAHVSFGADNASTRQAIEAGLPDLAGALREAGFTLAGGGVSQHARERGGDGSDGKRSDDRDGSRSRVARATEAPARIAALRHATRAGGIDLYA